MEVALLLTRVPERPLSVFNGESTCFQVLCLHTKGPGVTFFTFQFHPSLEIFHFKAGAFSFSLWKKNALVPVGAYSPPSEALPSGVRGTGTRSPTRSCSENPSMPLDPEIL